MKKIYCLGLEDTCSTLELKSFTDEEDFFQ